MKVSDVTEAVDSLEKEVGFCLRGYVAGTTLVPHRLQIPVNNLTDYLRDTLGLTSTGTTHTQTHTDTDTEMPDSLRHYISKRESSVITHGVS